MKKKLKTQKKNKKTKKKTATVVDEGFKDSNLPRTTHNVASRFFASTPSRIRRIVKICDAMDLFLRMPFWFFQSMFSILGSMRLRMKKICGKLDKSNT